jgi:methylthioribose-1-phosphate isomerase
MSFVEPPTDAVSEEDFSPIQWRDESLYLLDQTRLPREEVWLQCRSPEQVAKAIRRLSVRGAPGIGVTAAYGLVVGMASAGDEAGLEERFEEVAQLLAATRPTAVNLRWALAQGRDVFEASAARGAGPVIEALLDWAHGLHRADVEANRRIGAFGAELFAEGDRVLTHCNTGALATAGYGTALGVIQASWKQGKVALVWVDETRPLLQGARLTTWELQRLGVPYRLISDSTAGALMARGQVDRVVVGADRIAANGDTANKIGTYTVAVLADRHNIPFYVAAPVSTIDPEAATGEAIPIEERDGSEVTEVFGTQIAPAEAEAANLAFDVTPHELIAAIITDRGVLEPPYTDSIAAALDEAAISRRGE